MIELAGCCKLLCGFGATGCEDLTDLCRNASRVFKKAVQQGRNEARGAMKNERHVCARRRVGSVLRRGITHFHPPIAYRNSVCPSRTWNL